MSAVFSKSHFTHSKKYIYILVTAIIFGQGHNVERVPPMYSNSQVRFTLTKGFQRRFVNKCIFEKIQPNLQIR
jgi:hypothetical protein